MTEARPQRLSTIPLTVIGGYLGAGKTTLLNSMLRRSDELRIGVIVNDFGELGIDAGLVEDAIGDEQTIPGVINLPNGCVCCTLGDDLGTALMSLADAAPLDQVVIEASGVADPAAVAAWSTVAPFSPGGTIVLAAADTVRAQARDRYVGGEVRRQLAGADLVVLTKVDRCDRTQVAAVTDWIATVTTSPVIESVGGDVPLAVMSAAPRRKSDQPSVGPTHADDLGTMYVTWSFVADREVEPSHLAAFLDSLPDGVLRLKGSLATGGNTTATVNVVGRRVDVASLPTSTSGARLEAIGVRDVLDVDALERLARHHLSDG